MKNMALNYGYYSARRMVSSWVPALLLEGRHVRGQQRAPNPQAVVAAAKFLFSRTNSNITKMWFLTAAVCVCLVHGFPSHGTITN